MIYISLSLSLYIYIYIYVYIYYLSSDLYKFLSSFVYSEEILHTIMIHFIDIPILMYKVSEEYWNFILFFFCLLVEDLNFSHS